MPIQLPTEIILYIFSLLDISNLCQLLKWSKNHQLKNYCKSTLLNQIKRRGKLDLYTPSDYFALLCNREMTIRPVLQLSCISFDSQSLTFQTTSFNRERLDSTERLRIYCPDWLYPFDEEDKEGDDLDWLWKQSNLQLVVSFNWFIQRMGIN